LEKVLDSCNFIVIDIADDGCTPEEIEDGKLFQALRK
jgi:hypothetical protein